MGQILTTQQSRCFEEHGIAFPIRVLSAEQAEQFRHHCDALETHLGGRPRTVEVRQMHLHFPWAYQLSTHPRVLDAVEDLLGPDLLIWATELFAKHPQDGVVTIGWHRDGPYMGLDPERTVTAWIALTASSRDSGCMRVVPELHRKQMSQWNEREGSGAERRVPDVPDDSIIDVTLEPGEMSLHDVYVLHGSGTNSGSQKRVGFAIRFTTPDSRPAAERPRAMLVRGEDRHGRFELLDPPRDNDVEHALVKMRQSARKHLDTTLANLKHATR